MSPNPQDDEDSTMPAPAPAYQPPAQQPFMPDDQSDKLKTLLYPYLMDKLARRGAATSSAAYGGMEKGLDQQARTAADGGVATALARASSQIGTLGGKSANTGVLSDYFGGLNSAAQQRFSNEMTLRGEEEKSLGTDNAIAKTVLGGDDADKQRKYLYQALMQKDADERAKQGLEGWKASHPPLQEAKDLMSPDGPPVFNPSPVKGGYQPGGAPPGTKPMFRPPSPLQMGGLTPMTGYDAPPGFIPMKDKFGKVTLVPAPAGVVAKDSKLGDKELDKGETLDNTISLLNDIVREKAGVQTGPLADFKNNAAHTIGVDDPRVSAFRAKVQTQFAEYLNQISGKVVTDNERHQLAQNVPTMHDSDAVFLEKAKFLQQRLGQIRDRYVRGLEATGKNVAPLNQGGGAAPIEAGTSAAGGQAADKVRVRGPSGAIGTMDPEVAKTYLSKPGYTKVP